MSYPALPFDRVAFEHRIPKFWARVDQSQGPTACWPWTGAANRTGYGLVRMRDHYAMPHRIAYQLVVGPIPDGFVIDHLCRNKRCVNPAHLEAVTHRENTMRGESVSARGARQRFCLNGHELPIQIGKRKCKPCERARAATKRARKAIS